MPHLYNDSVALGLGSPAAVTALLGGTPATGLSGAGTSSQANALALTAPISVFGTVALNSGARLPAFGATSSNVLDEYLVCNDGANPLLLYPATGESINALSANASFSVTNGRSALCKRISSTTWRVYLSG